MHSLSDQHSHVFWLPLCFLLPLAPAPPVHHSEAMPGSLRGLGQPGPSPLGTESCHRQARSPAAPNQPHSVLSRCRMKPFQEAPSGGEQRTDTGVLGRGCALSDARVLCLATRHGRDDTGVFQQGGGERRDERRGRGHDKEARGRCLVQRFWEQLATIYQKLPSACTSRD